mgnify:FL=1
MEEQIEDKKLKEIFNNSKVIALVGASANKEKTSHIVMKYLLEFGYEVIPVNPGAAGQEILGQMAVKNLSEIKKPIDIVDIFRPSAEAEIIIKDAIKYKPKTIWLQLGITSVNGNKFAKTINANYIQNSCIKTEYERIMLN